MDLSIIINVVLFVITQAIFWHVLDIKRTQRATSEILKTISSTLAELVKYAEHGNEKERNTIRAINEMCNALNQSFSTTGEFMNHTSYTLQNITMCMIPFIDNIKERALKNEDYEKAQECVNIIKNLKEAVKHISSN